LKRLPAFPQFLRTTGRAVRREYWFFVLVVGGAAAVSTIAGELALTLTAGRRFELWLSVATALPPIAFIIPTTVRRLHDRDRSGHWAWMFVFVPFALSTIFYLLRTKGAALTPLDTLLTAGSMILQTWGLIELGLLPGTLGPNRFGVNPAPHAR
jgi:uncharacterized membrane protein YhaH (DUF805 family)